LGASYLELFGLVKPSTEVPGGWLKNNLISIEIVKYFIG
jgi:hypothetical protein